MAIALICVGERNAWMTVQHSPSLSLVKVSNNQPATTCTCVLVVLHVHVLATVTRSSIARFCILLFCCLFTIAVLCTSLCGFCEPAVFSRDELSRLQLVVNGVAAFLCFPSLVHNIVIGEGDLQLCLRLRWAFVLCSLLKWLI